MSERYDVTFIRGPRDVSPWKQAARQISLLTNSPQSAETAMQARSRFTKKEQNIDSERFPNAMYELKGWVR